jgi:2-hydroxy-3-keto-5-methylthiopentenyl-1-phosphate phosphatase
MELSPRRPVGEPGPLMTRSPVEGRTVQATVLDFDGAVCPHDVTEELLRAFAPPAWWDIEREMRARRIGLREALTRQASLLSGSRDRMLAFALERFELDPSFPPFASWASSRGMALAVASDGLGFYIEPMLAAAGVDGVRVMTNRFDDDTDDAVGGEGGLTFPFGHPVCVGCGTCKMLAVVGSRVADGDAVAFVGEGYSDRFGAVYADVTFAKHHLARLCDEQGILFVPWDDYDDVRRGLEAVAVGRADFTGPVDPARCPGWTEPEDRSR